jgi:apolipoprotein D and lipocalin family protein
MPVMIDLPPVQTVAQVELNRYVGKWYEIARFPNRFQRQCESDVTATYALRPDGKIDVLNECRTPEGRIKKATGTARPADAKGPASKLKVTFLWPFSGDYWIIALDPEYRWAVVGDPSRKYLWILAREPRISEDLYRDLVGRALAQQFDVGRLVRTKSTRQPTAP